jgi:formate dehydrogenase accessory protein FdhD
LKELSIGHILSEGMIKSLDEIREISLGTEGKCKIKLRLGIDSKKRIGFSQPFARLIVSACGSTDYWPISKLADRLDLPNVARNSSINAKIISESVKQLNLIAKTFRKTGGVHIAALFSVDGELYVFAEDVGRHNAVDKVVGAAALKNVDFKNCFLALSGRLTGDIVLKAARIGIPLIASMTAALDSGIDVALRTGITLVGFVRGKRITIYTNSERVNLSSS